MTTAAAQARYPLSQGVNPWLVTVSVMLPTFMEVLDTAIASVALPYIAGSLSASNSEATWVLTSYLVANAVILPASNWFAFRFGRKRSCCSASSFSLSLRFSAGLLRRWPSSYWRGCCKGRRRRFAATVAVDSAGKLSCLQTFHGHGCLWAWHCGGPGAWATLGGWLTDTFSWRYAFYINIPVGSLRSS